MVQFGKRLLALQHEPWQSSYLDYGRLKRVLENTDGSITAKLPAARREREFERQLNQEIEKSVLFFLQIQGHIAKTLSVLRDDERRCAMDAQDVVGNRSNDAQQAAVRRRLQELAHSYKDVGETIVHLVRFVELTVTGLRKILKKHDKRFKGNKLLDRYLSDHFHNTEDSHLRQLFHYEGVGALVASLQEAFLELKVIEHILFNSVPKDAAGVNRHRRTMTEPNLVGPSSLEPVRLTPGPSRSRKASTEGPEYWDENVSALAESVLFKIDAARRRLRESSGFVSLLAASAMMDQSTSEDDLSEILPYCRPEVSSISSLLNLLSTFLYMTNYYIVAPTSGAYAAKLGGHEALSGIIIGMTPIAALVSTILYSWWTSRSYKAALVFASACSVIGNILYALGLPYRSLTLVIIGRLLNGFGSARSINRRYIADSFSRQDRTAASAAFVTAGALGMSAGPAMAALLDLSPSGSTYWSAENASGWIMSMVWLVYLFALVVFFQDPPKHDELMESRTETADIELTGESMGLLSTGGRQEQIERVSRPLWQNIPVIATLLVYFVIKLALECALSSTATLTSFYFNWGPQASGLYLAVLGLLMFPANLLVAYYSRIYEDRELIVYTLILLLVGLWGIVDYGHADSYSLAQYIFFGIVVFVGANAVEGPNMSLLSKTIPKSWAKGLFNVGLLSTEAGTLGRATGDVFITWCGLSGIGKLLNHMFISLGILVGVTVVATYEVYPSLEPQDDKDD